MTRMAHRGHGAAIRECLLRSNCGHADAAPAVRETGATKRAWYTSDGWLRDPYKASLVRVERVETDDIGWGQRQVADAKRKAT